MTKLSEKLYLPIQKDIEKYLYAVMWEDIHKLLLEGNMDIKLNAGDDPLIKAIEDGEIYYSNGVFSGRFNMRRAKRLAVFARYDKRSKTWRGTPPSDVSAAAAIANNKSRLLHDKVKKLIYDTHKRVEDSVDQLELDIKPVVQAVVKSAESDLLLEGISVQGSTVISQRQIEDYREAQKISIRNFTDEQTRGLTQLIRDNTLAGYNRNELIELIQSQYDVTKSKAKFLARQETSLLVSNIRNERFSQSGVDIAIWSSSGDARVVGTPGGKFPVGTKDHGNHYNMHGKYVRISDPTIYAENIEDVKNGVWKSKSDIGGDNRHAGESYNCRCVYKPVII